MRVHKFSVYSVELIDLRKIDSIFISLENEDDHFEFIIHDDDVWFLIIQGHVFDPVITQYLIEI